MKIFVVGVWGDEAIDMFAVSASSEESAIDAVKESYHFGSDAKFRAKELPAEIGVKPVYLIDLWD